jgi:hypothetical protein
VKVLADFQADEHEMFRFSMKIFLISVPITQNNMQKCRERSFTRNIKFQNSWGNRAGI